MPEGPFLLSKVSEHIKETLAAIRNKHQSTPHGIVLLAETAIAEDAVKYLSEGRVELSPRVRSAIEKFIDDGRRVRGQTPDDLRSAGRNMPLEGVFWKSVMASTGQPDLGPPPA